MKEDLNQMFMMKFHITTLFLKMVPLNFLYVGEDWVFFDTYFNRKEFSADYVWQINKIHNLSIGATLQKLKTDLVRRNPDGGVALEQYSYHLIR